MMQMHSINYEKGDIISSLTDIIDQVPLLWEEQACIAHHLFLWQQSSSASIDGGHCYQLQAALGSCWHQLFLV